MNNIKFELKANIVEELEAFTSLLNKDHNTILNEALELYFANAHEQLSKKNKEDENALTNFDFDEFWDDIDID